MTWPSVRPENAAEKLWFNPGLSAAPGRLAVHDRPPDGKCEHSENADEQHCEKWGMAIHEERSGRQVRKVPEFNGRP